MLRLVKNKVTAQELGLDNAQTISMPSEIFERYTNPEEESGLDLEFNNHGDYCEVTLKAGSVVKIGNWDSETEQTVYEDYEVEEDIQGFMDISMNYDTQSQWVVYDYAFQSADNSLLVALHNGKGVCYNRKSSNTSSSQLTTPLTFKMKPVDDGSLYNPYHVKGMLPSGYETSGNGSTGTANGRNAVFPLSEIAVYNSNDEKILNIETENSKIVNEFYNAGIKRTNDVNNFVWSTGDYLKVTGQKNSITGAFVSSSLEKTAWYGIWLNFLSSTMDSSGNWQTGIDMNWYDGEFPLYYDCFKDGDYIGFQCNFGKYASEYGLPTGYKIVFSGSLGNATIVKI